MDKIEHLKKSIEKQQGVFTTYKKNPELVTKLSFKLCECLAEKGKPFSDREFIKDCLTIFTEYACPEKKHLVDQTSLSRFTVSRRTNDLSDNIKETLKEKLKSCEAFSWLWMRVLTSVTHPNLSFSSELILLPSILLKSF